LAQLVRIRKALGADDGIASKSSGGSVVVVV
jgi:hypothetical protein